MMSEHGEISDIVIEESKLRVADSSNVVGDVERIAVKRVIVLAAGHAGEEDQEQEFDQNKKNKKKPKR